MKLKIKKGSTVQVIAGADKGKKGTVLEIVTSKMGVRVQGVRVQTHYSKQDGLQKKEGLIHYSNLKLVDGPAAKAPAKKTKAAASKKA
ncbi:MAG: KOW motif-containing protein [Bdellovibrionales bacterium]|nr:KOW motif-containing protein [Bdellovibrionales bacterium]